MINQGIILKIYIEIIHFEELNIEILSYNLDQRK